MATVLHPYARKDPRQAMQWVQNWPSGPHTDAALTAIIEQIREEYAETARDLAAQITDGDIRDQALKEIERYNSR